MAEGIAFAGANKTFAPPPGDDGTIAPLPTFINGTAIVSCWQLSEEELVEVNRTGRVFLSCLSGRTLFPVFVGSESEVRRIVADTGPTFAADQDAPQRPREAVRFILSREVIELAHQHGGVIECEVADAGDVQAHVIPAAEDDECVRIA